MTCLLDTGQRPMWTPDQRRTLDRCLSCEQHIATQGHHDYCPQQEATP